MAVADPVRTLARRSVGWARANRVVRNLLDDDRNAAAFTDVHEHEKMVADAVRVDAYAAAIGRAVGPGDVVLDLGTGTGILAMLAARRGAEVVYAVDHSPFIEVARHLAEANGVADRITFVAANSRTFTPPRPVDLLLHEQLGDDLFDENMLENLLDLKRRVLAPGGRILPGRFELFVEPVALRDGFRVPALGEQRVHGLDFTTLAEGRGRALLDRYLADAPDTRYLATGAVDRFLGEPAPLLTVDLAAIDDPAEVPTTFTAEREVAAAGRLDGFCVHFRAILDGEASITTSPLEPRTHWGNRLFRVPGRECAAGDVLRYRVDLTEITRGKTWRVALEPAP